MDVERLNSVWAMFNRASINLGISNTPTDPATITNIKNDLTRLSESIAKEQPYFSKNLFNYKDCLFDYYGMTNPFVFGQIYEILKFLKNSVNLSNMDQWSLIHPQIVSVSRQLYLDGHYADAACDAFIEINDRVKKLFQKLRPGESVPDGEGAMKTVFSANSPIVKICDQSTQSGQNTQKGYMEMLAGSMSALRNPKAHANITITAEDAMRQLMFASMLMYKIDEAVQLSGIIEK